MEEYLLLAKESFFKSGISPNEFKRTKMEDIKDIMDISDAWDLKSKRENAINKAVAEMR